MTSYDRYLSGQREDYELPQASIDEALRRQDEPLGADLLGGTAGRR